MNRPRAWRFEEPHEGLQESYRDLIREFRDAGEALVPFPLTFPNDDFPAFLARLAAHARGEYLPPGFVPHSTYWLVSDGRVVGVANLRHALTDSLRREGGHIGYGVRPSARRRGFAGELLRHTLLRARELGLREVLITCAATNAASARTIRGQGGVLLSEEFIPERDEVVQRYRIDLAASVGSIARRTHMRTVKQIGIVAVSAEGAALCYRTICVEGAAVLGAHNHPPIAMHTYPLAEYMRHIEDGRWDEAARLLLASAGKLVQAGAELLICPDNTIHQAIDLIREASPVRWLHIAEEVAGVAMARRFERVGILGTRYLMEGPVYPAPLARRGIAYEVPQARDRERINDAIFGELVYGRLMDETRRYFQGVIRSLGERGCDAVVLGCTEIPLLIGESDSTLPTLDSTRILARAALREAVGG